MLIIVPINYEIPLKFLIFPILVFIFIILVVIIIKIKIFIEKKRGRKWRINY